jgi:hypothetical protein
MNPKKKIRAGYKCFYWFLFLSLSRKCIFSFSCVVLWRNTFSYIRLPLKKSIHIFFEFCLYFSLFHVFGNHKKSKQSHLENWLKTTPFLFCHKTSIKFYAKFLFFLHRLTNMSIVRKTRHLLARRIESSS